MLVISGTTPRYFARARLHLLGAAGWARLALAAAAGSAVRRRLLSTPSSQRMLTEPAVACRRDSQRPSCHDLRRTTDAPPARQSYGATRDANASVAPEFAPTPVGLAAAPDKHGDSVPAQRKRYLGVILSTRSKVVIKRFEDLIAALIPVVNLHLLVLVSNKFLNVNTTLTCH